MPEDIPVELEIDPKDRVETVVENIIAFVDAQADELRPVDSSRRVDRPDFTHLVRRDLRRILRDRHTS